MTPAPAVMMSTPMTFERDEDEGEEEGIRIPSLCAPRVKARSSVFTALLVGESRNLRTSRVV